MTVKNKLSFEAHLNTIYNKVNQKLDALINISEYVSKRKLMMIMIALINIGYCPVSNMDASWQNYKQ